MIPVRLELKNFMSYGEDVPPLDFTGMHMICLSGENGNGKSALLDAITWSLWGESRAGKNRHDDLVRIGADEMSVQFTFDMDGLRFRVMRKRSKRAGGNQWELQQEITEGSWRSLTGNNSGETEKAILKLLRMSYDTFLNSAYLRQGQADQFVKQPPGKRKEILADILDLSRYDELEAKARERAREAGVSLVDVERDINLINAELRQEDGYKTSLAEQQAKLADLQAKQQALTVEIDELNKQIGQIQAQKAAADQIATRLTTVDREIRDLEAQLREQGEEEARFTALVNDRDAIEAGFAELQQVRERLELLQVDLRKFQKGQLMISDTESQYAIASNEARRNFDQLSTELLSAEAKLKDLPRVRQDHALVAARIAELDKVNASKLDLQSKRAELAERLRKLELENVALSQQITAWDERLTSLSQQAGVCMVCNAPLSEERAAAVKAEYDEAKQLAVDRRRHVWAEGKTAKQEAAALDQEISAFEKKLMGADQDRVLFGQSEQRLKELDAVGASVPELKLRYVEAKRIVDDEQFAPELKARLDNYRAHLQKLEHAPKLNQDTRLRLAELENFDRKHVELRHAAESLASSQARKLRDAEALEARRISRVELQKELERVAAASTALTELTAECRRKQASLSTLQSEDRIIGSDIGRLGDKLANCAKMRLERTEKATVVASLRKSHECYDQLVKAFGKKGVQALIIENAIPELQEEANRLLERLTDGDMMMYFNTLREAKTKRDTPIETLEIQVSDSLGTRPLEMYSGGESFRAAFALRIALSKLLARRAGARLQTLIIDEGFGTQDGKGREKLVDALNAIKDDFEKIIVITHIDELKDAFATRVEVVKTPRGSQITVMEGATG